MKPLLTAVALAALIASPAWAQNLAIVNGKPVPASRVDTLLQQVARSGGQIDEKMQSQVKEEVIAREIFMQEAERLGLKASPGYQSQMELAAQAILIRELFNDFQVKNAPTDADIKAEYDKFVAASQGEEYQARHILVESEQEAKAIIASLKKGAKFEDLAKQKSTDKGSGARGGDLGWANPRGFVPEFAEAMIALKKGQTSQTPVKSQFGWHIIKLEDTRAAQLPTLEDLRGDIVQQLQQQRLAAYQAQLRDKAKVE